MSTPDSGILSVVPTPIHTLWDFLCWWFFCSHCLWPCWRRKGRPARGSAMLVWTVLEIELSHRAIAPARGNPWKIRCLDGSCRGSQHFSGLRKSLGGLPDFSFVSCLGFCCFHEAACLSCFQIFHSIVLHRGYSICSEHTYVRVRRSCSAALSCNPSGWTIWLIQYRFLHNLSPYSPSDTFAMCMNVVLGD